MPRATITYTAQDVAELLAKRHSVNPTNVAIARRSKSIGVRGESELTLEFVITMPPDRYEPNEKVWVSDSKT